MANKATGGQKQFGLIKLKNFNVKFFTCNIFLVLYNTQRWKLDLLFLI